MMKMDFHMHSKYSIDALSEPRSIIKLAKKQGLTISLTDHNLVKGWDAIRGIAKEEGVEFIQGEEVITYVDGKPQGELIGLFLNEPIKSRNPFEMIDEVRAQGAVLSVPHPFDRFRKCFKLIDQIVDKIDLIEAHNARCYFTHYNKLAKEFIAKHELVGIYASDAHMPYEVGNAYNMVDANTVEEARQKMLKGEFISFGKKAPWAAHFDTALARRHWKAPW